MGKYRGVSETHGRHQAQIWDGNRLRFLGCFDTAEQAAVAYDQAAMEYKGDKAKLNFSERLITVYQEQVYKLVHPDFYNLPYWAAALLLHVSPATVCLELKKIKQKCPSLFPLYRPVANNKQGMNRPQISYEKWMDYKIVEKF